MALIHSEELDPLYQRLSRVVLKHFTVHIDLEIDWLAVMDELKHCAGIPDDRVLAYYLDMQPSALSDFRNGRAGLNLLARLKLLDHLGFHKTSEAIERLEKEELRARSEKNRKRRATKLAKLNEVQHGET